MTSPELSHRSDRRMGILEGVARSCGAFAIVLGLLVILGWALQIPLLKSVLPGYVSMKANTALAFISAGASLLLRMRRGGSAVSAACATALALTAALLGLANLAEYALPLDLGIDELLFHDPGGPGAIPPPGRMAPLTACAFVLYGTALALLDRPRARRIVQAFGATAAFLSAVVLAAYAYDITSILPVAGYSSVAIHTAVGLLVLALGIGTARPVRGLLRIAASDMAGGMMARRLVPAALLVPPVLGWLCLKGQEEDLFDSHLGLALLAIGNVLVFLALVAGNAVRLYGIESERRTAQESLKANEARLRLMVAHTPAAVAMLDHDMRYLLVSPRWMTDFKLGERDIVGRSHYEVFPEIPERWREVHRRCLAGAAEACEEDSFVREDGSVEWLRWEIQPWRDARGEIGGIVIFVELTTERRRADERIRRSEEQLRHSQRMEAIGRLAGGVAHDFNNLLTVINGYAELLQTAIPRDDLCRESVREIASAGQRAAGLTRQLLAFSRRQVLDPRVLSLNDVLSGMERMIRRLIGEDVELVAVLSEDLGLVTADPGQMEQVVLNLAVNARDAMPSGGRLTLETKNVDLDEEDAAARGDVRPGPHVMLAVSDTGAGMDAETRSRIFEPFFTTKEAGKGTGLGLSTVYGIVEQSGGHVWVYSEPGQGATFKIYLPRVEAPARPSRPISCVSGTLDGSETVLVVEDDEALRRLVSEVLTARGYRVLAAGMGEEALALARGHTGVLHLLVTDVVMPGMSGRAVAEAIGADRPAMKVLYISGYAENAIVHHGRLDAGIELLSKPFGPDGLARKVRAVLDALDERP